MFKFILFLSLTYVCHRSLEIHIVVLKSEAFVVYSAQKFYDAHNRGVKKIKKLDAAAIILRKLREILMSACLVYSGS